MYRFTDPVPYILACAALNHDLCSVLLFDVNPAQVYNTAVSLTKLLRAVTNQTIEQISLGSSEAEDDLWSSPSLYSIEGIVQFVSKPGLLSHIQNDYRPRLVVIPDLTQLSLAAARACIMLMGADIAYLERHGQSEYWKPTLYWLAGCDSNKIGQISPHLLDRFVLRLSEKTNGNITDQLERLQAQMSTQASQDGGVSPHSTINGLLRQVTQIWPPITDEAVARVTDYFVTSKGGYARREIALTRLAHAMARLEVANAVMTTHVDRAAQIIGLEPQAQLKEEKTPLTDPVSKSSRTQPARVSNSFGEISTGDILSPSQQQMETSGEPVYRSGSDESLPTLPSEYGTPLGNLYPEDIAPVKREFATLHLPLRQSRSAALRGPIIGIERTSHLRDLALVSTLFEAAKFQQIRQKYRRKIHHHISNHLILSPTDLHGYRRSPISEQMLLLLIDYTCLHGWDWWQVVKLYVQWAYTERATVSIIQVGAGNAQHYLRAERVIARNVLAPQINAALQAPAGHATPLAHGLELALQTLRPALQHGRSRVLKALFVIVSDGRGNVPLRASHENRIAGPVGREGIDDTLEMAHSIGDLSNLRTLVIAPPLELYADLPSGIAAELGATLLMQQQPEDPEVA